MIVPCETCVLLAVCKSRYIQSKRETKSPLANLYILIDKCHILDDYLFEHREGRASRIFNAHDIFNGVTK